MRYLTYILIALGIIALDQITKLAVNAYMAPGLPGEILLLGNWLKLHYTTNPGMAFGIQLGSQYGKVILTSFRVVAMLGIAYYLYTLVDKRAHWGLLACVALILGGATGNIIDSVFYGVLLHNAPLEASSPWFHGQVVDMIFVDLWEGVLPKWLPILGGQYYSLWPIFNIADASIFCGIGAILIFQSKFFGPDAQVLAVAKAPSN